MGWWTEHVVPRLVDASCGAKELLPYRESVCSGLSGRVLEVGFGSGLNVRHYPADVDDVGAVEPSDVAWRRARQRLERSSTPVTRTDLDGQQLSEPDDSVDHVLSTFTMCTIPDLAAALSEIHRVLRPGGEVHFLEHGLAPDQQVRTWQRRLEPVQRRVAGGCHLTRQPVEALQAAGFQVTRDQRDYFPGPFFTKPLGYVYRGVAVRA